MTPNDGLTLNDAFTVLTTLKREKLALNMVHPYKGMLLDQVISVVEVKPDIATFQATNMPMCAALAGHTYLNSQELPKPLEAQVEDISLSTGELVLSEFAYLESDWQARQHIRVCPKRPTYVTTRRKEVAFRASLENLSVTGIGLLAYKFDQIGSNLKPGTRVCLDFKLFPQSTLTGLKATLVYVQSLGSSMTRLGMRIYPTSRQIHMLERYVHHRRDEILAELERTYWLRKDPLRIEYQYF